MPTINNPIKPTAPSESLILADEIRSLASAIAPFLVNSHQRIYQKLWVESVKMGVTPQAVLDELGSDASKLFSEGSNLVTFLLSSGLATMDESEYAPRQKPIFNPDGTVTLIP